MSSTGFGFYTDAVKTVTIIESLGNFRSNPSRKDFFKGGDYRLSDGDLETYEIVDKFEGILVLTNIRKTDRDLLKTEYDLHRSFFYFPDVINDPTTYYEVKWVGGFGERPNQDEERYSFNIVLKQV